MRTHPPNLLLRVPALVVALLCTSFDYANMSDGLGASALRATAGRYDNLFTPAQYSFAIWGLIHLAFIGYASLALLPSQSRIALHDRVAPPFIAANLLTSAWPFAFAWDQPTLALGIVVLMLVAGIAMYRRVIAALTVGPQHRLWLVPFSLFLAWVSVATVASATVALVAHGAFPKVVPWGLLMLAFVVGLGVLMAARFRDYVFPAVVAWGCLALAVRGSSSSELFGAAAMMGFAASVVASAAVLIVRAEQMFGLGVPIQTWAEARFAPAPARA
jgi:hypothetical protein